jgi:putative flavoprotein involved in K+ transport
MALPFATGRQLEIHASQYRNPQQLLPGAVLVVGSGNSGCQIAEELCSAGRQVYLSVGRHRRVPRRYRGKDFFWWYLALGYADTTIDQRRGGVRPSILITGVDGGHDVDLRRLAADGVILLGRVVGCEDGKLAIADDLDKNVFDGDAAMATFLEQADAYTSRNDAGLLAADADGRLHDPKELNDPIHSLDLNSANVSTIIWANGYRYDYDWVKLPIFAVGPGSSGEPIHKRGVTNVPGVYVLGLPWLHKLKSSFLHGVGEDAEHLADHIDLRTSRADQGRDRTY